MNNGWQEFWENAPDGAFRPTRTRMLEALSGADAALSVGQLVDAVDLDVSKTEVARHLLDFKARGIVAAAPGDASEKRSREGGRGGPAGPEAGDDG